MDYLIQTPTQLGIHLRSRRHALKLTQAKTADSLNLSQKRLSTLERNPDRLTVAQLLALASAMNMEVVLRERPQLKPSASGEW